MAYGEGSMKFVAIVGTQRSGTTVLRSVLGTHPEVTSFGEVFLPRHIQMEECFFYYLRFKKAREPYWQPSPEGLPELFREFLNYLAKKAGTEVVVFDCKYQFIRDELLPGAFSEKTPPVWDYLKNEDVKVIHLVRENLVATYVSGLLSSRTKVWATDDPKAIDDRTVEMPTEGLEEKLQGRLNEVTGFKRILSDHHVTTVVYENLFVDGRVPSHLLDHLARFMGVKNQFNPIPRYKKIGLPLSKSIRNYDDVKKALAGTPFASQLEG